MGKHVRFVGEKDWRTVVGIVADVRAYDLRFAGRAIDAGCGIGAGRAIGAICATGARLAAARRSADACASRIWAAWFAAADCC